MLSSKPRIMRSSKDCKRNTLSSKSPITRRSKECKTSTFSSKPPIRPNSKHYRRKESVGLEFFSQLNSGDILSIDGPHTSKQGRLSLLSAETFADASTGNVRHVRIFV